MMVNMSHLHRDIPYPQLNSNTTCNIYSNNNKSIYIAPNQSRLLSGALQNMAN